MPDCSTLTIILPGRTDYLDNIPYAFCAQSLFIFLIMAIINKKCNVLPTIIHYVEKVPYVELTRGGNRLQYYCCRFKNMNGSAANIQGFGMPFRNFGERLSMKGSRSLIVISKGFETFLPEEKSI